MTSRTSLPFSKSPLLAFVLMLCGFAICASAQRHGAIAGTDLKVAVLPRVQISIQNPNLAANANEQGRYYINDLTPGTYNLAITSR